MWPTDRDELIAAQRELAGAEPAPWRLPDHPLAVGGCWVCFPRGLTGPGQAGDPAWTAAVTLRRGRPERRNVETGMAEGPYEPGLMALRVGQLLETAVRHLPEPPDVLLLDATGRDHPRRAGLAVHLGAVLDLPTVGVTHRPLEASGDWPPDHAGATSPLRIDSEIVACWLRSRAGTRPLAVHPGWRTDLDVALSIVRAALAGHRTPEPLRRARRLARRARAGSESAEGTLSR